MPSFLVNNLVFKLVQGLCVTQTVNPTTRGNEKYRQVDFGETYIKAFLSFVFLLHLKIGTAAKITEVGLCMANF